MNDPIKLRTAIKSPLFSHARAGNLIYSGCTLIYHRDSESPSGVSLICVGDAHIVDPLIRELRNTSALSPTEGRY